MVKASGVHIILIDTLDASKHFESFEDTCGQTLGLFDNFNELNTIVAISV